MSFIAKEKNRKILNGFTIVELLVVILIIGVLAGAVLTVVNPAGLQSRTRDSNRMAELAQLSAGIEAYVVAEGRIPASSDDAVLRDFYLRTWPEGVDDQGNPSSSFAYTYTPLADGSGFVITVPNTSGSGCFKYHSAWGQTRDCSQCGEDAACVEGDPVDPVDPGDPGDPGDPTPPPPTNYSVTVRKNTASYGTVSVSSPSGDGGMCGTTCTSVTRSYPSGSSVTASASPASGYNFVRWVGGPCAGSTSSSCSNFQLVSNQDFTAEFGQSVSNYTATVSKSIATGGTLRLVSGPFDLICDTGCGSESVTRPEPSSVTATITPASGFTFDGWFGGPCAGSLYTSCTFDIMSNTSFSAILSLQASEPICANPCRDSEPICPGGDVQCNCSTGIWECRSSSDM